MAQKDASIAAVPVVSRFRVSARALLMSAISLVVAIVLAVSAAGATYALLNSATTAGSAATIKSGTATLAVSTALSMPTTPMYPGLTLYGSAVLTNTGDVPLTVAMTGLTGPTTSTAFSQALTIGVATAESAASCSAGRVTSPWITGTFAAPAAGAFNSTLALSADSVLCVSVSLSSTAPTGAQTQSASNFGIVVNGTQA